MAKLAHNLVETMARSRGLKMTPQRRMIVEYLQAASHHPTADEILTAVNRKFPMASRATVYNTLNWLKEAGMVREVYEGGSVRFDPNAGHHHHFVCRACGRLEDVECDLIGALKVCALPGRQKVEQVEVTLRGLCAACQKGGQKSEQKTGQKK
jgi:Fur family transcriptional regulator, peroxide stress response regulator